MKLRLLLLFLGSFFIAAHTLNAQNIDKRKCKKGCLPQANLFLVKGDSLVIPEYLELGKPNHMRFALDGGIEKVRHEMKVTSKNAIVTKVPGTTDEFIVTPQSKECEIIVDVRTFENYYLVQRVTVKGKEEKRVIRTYPPKTYMVGYERFIAR
jgi:hypothetical protein